MIQSSPLAMFLKWEKEIPNDLFLRQPVNGVWKQWTWQQAGEEIRKIASGLRSLNFPEKSHIALLSKNCAEWIICDLAIMMAGYISIPIYPTLTSISINPILVHSDSKAIIRGKLDDYNTQKDGIPAGIIKISMERYNISEEKTLEQMLAQQMPLQEIYNWNQEDILSIIYTSGTTGKSKGVMHCVSAFDTVVQTAVTALALPQRPVLFSYLPLSHIAERMGIELNALYSGGKISFAESLENFPKNLTDTQPQVFFAVPRIWAKFKEKILVKIPQKKLNQLLSIPFVSGLIKKKIRKNLGLANASHIYSAAAPLSLDILHWFDKLGIPICQAYGMTEDCVYSHFCSPMANKYGTVGKPLPGIVVKIADDGEIRKKCAGDMKGYYKEPAMTADTFDEAGYLKTGDIGEYDKDGYLLITGRVKDIFKTDKGKYISPAPIELQLLSNTNIEHVCVVGTGVPQPMALVTLSDGGKLKSKEEVAQIFSELISTINPALEKFEMLEKIVIMKNSWTIANGLITPTLKVKRNEIERMHLPKYPSWFEEKGLVILEK